MYVGHDYKLYGDRLFDANDYRLFTGDLHTSKLVQIAEQSINE